MTRLLSIETSAEACSVAVDTAAGVLETVDVAPMRHAELLLPAIERLLGESGLSLPDLDAIAFGRGPGSFTSLRIGIGVVQGLAWGADLPVVPVSSLAAVAQAAADGAGEQGDTGLLVRVAVDARMQEVYCGSFRIGPDGLVASENDERVCPPGAAFAPVEDSFLAAGNGFERFDELRGEAEAAIRCLPGLWPTASRVARLARAWLQTNEALPAARAQPVYLRNKVAEKPGSSG